jgi:hypothetical protein
MRKLVAAAATAALLAAPVQSAVAGKKAAHQHVEGTIAVPQGGNAAATCVYRTQRTLFGLGGQNGVFGYTFDVDPGTVGKKFKLEAGAADVGLDISFYADMGDPTDPSTAPANYAYENPGPGGESGTVPAGYPIAFVCMTEGANGSFTYLAGKGVK